MLFPLCALSLFCLPWYVWSLLAALPVKDTCPHGTLDQVLKCLGRRRERQGLQGPFCIRAWLCPRWAAGEGRKRVPDNNYFCFLLLLPPLLLRGKSLQRAVVGAGLKAGRGGSLHGSSTQAGRKWPCAKAGSDCCQTGRGGWAVGWGKAGTNPVERWVGRGSALLGRSELFPSNSELSGDWKEVCLRVKVAFLTRALIHVLSPWVVESVPGPSTVDQTSSVVSPFLGLRILCLAGTALAVGKDAV